MKNGFKHNGTIDTYRKHDMVKKYTRLLREYLEDNPLLGIVVVGSQKRISLQNLKKR